MLEQADGAQDHAGRAPSTLHGVGLEKSLLHGMKLAGSGEAFDGDDVFAGEGADLGEATILVGTPSTRTVQAAH